MSQQPSSTPPTSSPGAGNEIDRASFADVIAAADQVASFGVFGIVWLDERLVARKTFGSLVSFVKLGKAITDSIVALVGLEEDILNLRETPRRVLELPAVGVPDETGSTKRLNFTFFWHSDARQVMLLIYRANSQTDLEMELSRQIRARLIAEGEASAKSRELARANADLESFAAIVSHDLKAPLRHMRQLADHLITDAAIADQGDAVVKLQQVQTLSRRMSHMLTELLDYASLGRKYEALAPVDTAALIASIVETVPASNHRIEIAGTWPVLTTLAAPLDLILRNLVQNALQHHDRERGTIRVTCTDEGSSLAITIADDGPGIAPEHHRAVFLPFRTLANGKRSGGTGIGLAMVKKMIETAGGKITISSDPARARGTTFTVLWPKQIRA